MRHTPLWPCLAVAALAFAMAWPMQGRSLGENSNYALVKALASGTATIDRTRFEVGDLPAGDFRTYRGHVYSDKAPGLAFVTLPAFVVLRALGLHTGRDSTRALWALRLWGTVVPAILLLLIAWRLADRVAPGFGAAAAVAVGAGTILLALSTLFYSHLLCACLVSASFLLLWTEPEGSPRPWLLAAAGVLAGFAAGTDYPAVLALGVFGVYAVLREPRLVRGVAFGMGAALGLTPLLAYNRWAFGSFTHLSYFGEELSSGSLGNRLDPSLINVLFTYVSLPGLLVLSPVLSCGLAGLWLLFRRGWRAEALAIGAVLTAFTTYNASLPGVEYDAFLSGPRYLVPVLPLLGAPIALAFARWPLMTGALTVVSIVMCGVLTASMVHRGAVAESDWFAKLRAHDVPSTAASLVGVTGWYAILVFFVALGAAVVAAIAASPAIDPSPRDHLLALLAVGAWSAGAALSPSLRDAAATTYRGYAGVLLVLVIFLALAVAVYYPRGTPRAAT